MFSIRKALIEDIQILQDLAHEIWTNHYADILSQEQINYMLENMYSTQTIQQEINGGVVWELIELNGVPIGFLAFTIKGDEVKLNKLYIKLLHHGKGYGQKALKHVIEYSQTKGCRRLYLTVNKNNTKAITAYEKAGFKRTDSKVFDIGKGFVMDDFIYSFSLN